MKTLETLEALDFTIHYRQYTNLSPSILIPQLLPKAFAVKVHLTPKMNFVLFERSLKMMKDGVNFLRYPFSLLSYLVFRNMQIM